MLDPKPLTYSSYLKIDELLGLQAPLSKPVQHDEMLFIVVHQAYELWFKQILFEMKALLHGLKKNNLIHCYRLLHRINEILRLLVQQVGILETMTPVEFNRFRSKLNPASGFQSLQFRELEWTGGIDPEEYKSLEKYSPEWKSNRVLQSKKPNLRKALFEFLKTKGFSAAPKDRVATICEIYKDPSHLPIQTLCEHLIEFDELFSLWRFRHVQMVERMIGMKRGTGGSLGVSYLKGTLSKRFFPELWEARTEIGADY